MRLPLYRSSRGRHECAAVAAAEPLPEIDDVAKEVCCAFGVVQRGMRLALIPFEPGRRCGTRQYGLADGEAAERGRGEGAEGVEGFAVDAAARHGGIEEGEVEGGVSAEQDGARAFRLAHSASYGLKSPMKR